MAGIVEPLRPARILAKPKRFAPLRSFSCGRNGKPWEKMVNEWARLLYQGTAPYTETVVVLEDATGRLIGFCSFRAHQLPIRGAKLARDTQRVHTLGTDRVCHGLRLEDGTRPGDALLRGALEQIKAACDGRMPFVSALVAPDNARSLALFDRHRFGQLPYAGEGDVIRVRAPYKALPIRVLPRTPIARRLVRWVAPKANGHDGHERRRGRSVP